jgi:hypothetical protein
VPGSLFLLYPISLEHQTVAIPEAATREATPHEIQNRAIPREDTGKAGMKAVRPYQGIPGHGNIRFRRMYRDMILKKWRHNLMAGDNLRIGI